MAQRAKSLPVNVTSHIIAHSALEVVLLPIQFSNSIHGKAAEEGQSGWVPTSMGEIQREFLAPGLGLPQPQQLWPFGGHKQANGSSLFLSPPTPTSLSHSVTLSFKQTNLKKERSMHKFMKCLAQK